MKLKTLLAAAALCAPFAANAAVLATIGDKSITTEDIKKEYDGVTSDQRKAINEDPATRHSVVDNAVNAEILVMAAKKAGLDKDEDYKSALARFERQFLATKFLQKSVEPKLNNSGVKKFYEENKNFFDTAQVCAHHIVMADEREAEKVMQLAKAKGVKFEDLAKKHSLDPSVQENKGNLGCFTREKMVPEFAAAAFNMRKGDIKGPVRTMYGFHVIRVDDIKPGRVPGYDEVEQRVKETYRVRLVNDILQDLRAKTSVKMDEEAINKFKM
jgi:peptidyl-prolyl cis-trans isomerase C